MARPFRLRYTNSSGENTLIGRFIGEAAGETDNQIQQGTLKNSGSGEFTRCEIKGDKNLLDNMPVTKSEFNTDYPEIVLDVYSLVSNGWIERDRVFAENTGTIENDRGEYRNDQLGGYEKWVSRHKTNTTIGPINTDLQDVVEALLDEVPDITFTVQTAGTIPSVNNYSFNGNIGAGLRDIHRDYPNVKLWFTGQTDASDQHIVKLEEKGAGSVVETVAWPDTDGYEIIEYEEEDTSIVVNRATVRGTDGSGNLIEVDTDDFASGTLASNITDSKNDYGERSLPPRNIGYLEDESHAQNIAENLLQLEAQPYLRISLPFQEQNVLNASIDLTDSRYDIDSVFTVVKQRDFFVDSKTEVELSFEKNRSEERREEIRDLGEERARLYPSGDQNVGEQDFTGDTGSAPSDTASTGGVDADPSDTNVNGSVDSDPSDTAAIGGVQQHANADLNTAVSTNSASLELSGSGWSFVTSVSNVDNDALYHQLIVIVTDIESGGYDLDIAIVKDGDAVVAHWCPHVLGTQNHDSLTGTLGDDGYYNNDTLILPNQYTGSSADYDVYMSTKGSGTPTIDVRLTAVEIYHTHPDDIDTQDNNHPHGDTFDTQDNDHPHGDNIDTDDFQHGGTGDTTGQHGTSGTTDPKNVDVATENKTDR